MQCCSRAYTITMACDACVVMENAAGSCYDVTHGRWCYMYFFSADALLPTFQHTIVNKQFYFQLLLLLRRHVRNPKNNIQALNMQIKSGYSLKRVVKQCGYSLKLNDKHMPTLWTFGRLLMLLIMTYFLKR